ncbi:MAG: type II toxin-antitoxin system RelE/ParE family toxin [Candidatus Marinimicrobia bacterium]|nr:type II toxin-antitoxin system RelE/ParE family toxin [Candidatus Neomarinimicrobiota bacterium]
MAYRLRFKRSVARDLRQLERRDQERVLAKIDKELIARPEKHPGLKGEYAGLRRLRVGKFRVIYAILDEKVVVLRVGHLQERG